MNSSGFIFGLPDSNCRDTDQHQNLDSHYKESFKPRRLMTWRAAHVHDLIIGGQAMKCRKSGAYLGAENIVLASPAKCDP